MLAYRQCKEMRAKRAAEGGSGGTPRKFFWISGLEVVSDAIYKCKNVATRVYIDLQLWAQCLLARAWISMATVTRRMQTQRFLFIIVQERPASY